MYSGDTNYNGSQSGEEDEPLTVIGGAFRKEFTDPMVWSDGRWVPIATPWVPLFEQVKWTVTFYVPNTSGRDWTQVILKDHFGAELDQADPGQYTASQGSVVFEYSKAKKMPQLRVIWNIGDLPDMTMATLSFDVVTRLNPAGKQEYTSPGLKILNSGANVKWRYADTRRRDSMSTPSSYVMAGNTLGEP